MLDLMAPYGGRAGLIAGFAVIHVALVVLGYALKESVNTPAVMWPAVGWLFVTLWMSPRSLWPAILATHYIIEGIAAAMPPEPFDPSTDLLYPLANAVDAVASACFVRLMIPDLQRVRMLEALRFVAATALGAAVGAVFGAAIAVADHSGPVTLVAYVHQAQIWWAGNWLGHLTVVPVVFCWLSILRGRLPALALKSRLELVTLFLLMVGSSIYVFANPGHTVSSLLQMPTVIVALLIYAAVRMPPRWVATLFAVTAVTCAWFASMRMGPFDRPDIFGRTGAVQTFLASIGVISFALSVSTTEKNVVLARLLEAEYRYRSFVELSAEAVWRVELEREMPVSLPLEQQLAWLRAHARIMEASRSYEQLDPRAAAAGALPWRSEVPWSVAYEENLAHAARQEYSIDGLRFSVDIRGRTHGFVTSFSGVVSNGCLLRIWGVARDITELTELNARLVREQERLKTYARQLVSAEEKARRSTAVDLHDGIGQTLVGMAMTLDVARQNSPADVALLIDEVRSRLREVQERTRQMITDLSPPGLYDLGLVPALQWLAVYMRGHDRLSVELDADVGEEWIKLDMRILIFKLVRELLRNVVKHAGVHQARVVVRGDDRQLQVEVSDKGRGFDSQMDMFGTRANGFGLWSIADRAQEVGGRFAVQTSVGSGSRFELVFPLGSVTIAEPQISAGAGVRV
ncbi:MAG: MASE1 domain-containing protein [Pseudomonadota bacterium]